MVAHYEEVIIYNDCTTNCFLEIVEQNFRECAALVAGEGAELSLKGCTDGHIYCTLSSTGDLKEICDKLNDFVMTKKYNESFSQMSVHNETPTRYHSVEPNYPEVFSDDKDEQSQPSSSMSLESSSNLEVDEFLNRFMEISFSEHLSDMDLLTSLRNHFSRVYSPFLHMTDIDKLIYFDKCFRDLQRPFLEETWQKKSKETRQIINYCQEMFKHFYVDGLEDDDVDVVEVPVHEQFSDGTTVDRTAIVHIHDNKIVNFKFVSPSSLLPMKAERSDKYSSLVVSWMIVNFPCMAGPCYPCDYVFATICTFFNLVFQDYIKKFDDNNSWFILFTCLLICLRCEQTTHS